MGMEFGFQHSFAPGSHAKASVIPEMKINFHLNILNHRSKPDLI